MLVSMSMMEEIGHKSFGGIAISGTFIMANSARSFGPALIFCNLSYNWI